MRKEEPQCRRRLNMRRRPEIQGRSPTLAWPGRRPLRRVCIVGPWLSCPPHCRTCPRGSSRNAPHSSRGPSGRRRIRSGTASRPQQQPASRCRQGRSSTRLSPYLKSPRRTRRRLCRSSHSRPSTRRTRSPQRSRPCTPSSTGRACTCTWTKRRRSSCQMRNRVHSRRRCSQPLRCTLSCSLPRRHARAAPRRGVRVRARLLCCRPGPCGRLPICDRVGRSFPVQSGLETRKRFTSTDCPLN